eukprot:403376414
MNGTVDDVEELFTDIKDLSSSSRSKYLKIKIEEKTYFVKKIPFSYKDLEKIAYQIQLHEKFGSQMIAQIIRFFYNTDFKDEKYLAMIFDYTDFRDLQTYSENTQIQDTEMREILYQIFTQLSVMHLSSYYHNDLKAKNYIVFKEDKSIKVLLSDFETISTDKNHTPQKLTVDQLFTNDIGFVQKTQKDVKSILDSINQIEIKQREKYGEFIYQEESKESFQSYYDSDIIIKMGGGQSWSPCEGVKIPQNAHYRNEFYELIQKFLVSDNDNIIAFEILIDKYLVQGQSLEFYMQKIISTYKMPLIQENMGMYMDFFFKKEQIKSSSYLVDSVTCSKFYTESIKEIKNRTLLDNEAKRSIQTDNDNSQLASAIDNVNWDYNPRNIQGGTFLNRTFDNYNIKQ